MSDVTLLKALVLLVPVGTLFSWSVMLFFRAKTVWHFLQLLGAGCLMIVVLTHLFEALNLFPWMGWLECFLGELSCGLVGVGPLPARVAYLAFLADAPLLPASAPLLSAGAALLVRIHARAALLSARAALLPSRKTPFSTLPTEG